MFCCSRDKEFLDDIVDEKWIYKFMVLSGLRGVKHENTSDNIVIEALKCLCNLVFNSKVVQSICAKNDLVDLITQRLLTYR